MADWVSGRDKQPLGPASGRGEGSLREAQAPEVRGHVEGGPFRD